MSNWISIEERLPEKYLAVLVWVVPREEYQSCGVSATGTYVVASYDGDGCWETWVPEEELDYRLKVVAWQELPKEYRKEKDDDIS